jgi:hypothetical protein
MTRGRVMLSPRLWTARTSPISSTLTLLEKLEALEREEERLEAEGFYNSDDSMVSRHLDLKDLYQWFSQTDSETNERSRNESRKRA